MLLFLILSGIALTGCSSDPGAPPTVFVAPPEQILSCKPAPEKPPKGSTSKVAAKYITKLHAAWKDCTEKLADVREFVEERVGHSVQN